MKTRSLKRTIGLSLLLVLVGALLGIFSPARADRYALIVGSGAFDPAWLSYGAVPPALTGVETDAHLIAELSSAQLGFPRKNIRIVGCPDSGFRADGYTYLGDRATYGIVTSELRRMVHEARPGDSCLVYYSGHGCRLSDDTRASGDADFLVLRNKPLFNFELYSILRKIKCRTTMVFDCCYSAGAGRTAGEPADTLVVPKNLTSLSDAPIRTVMNQRKHALGIPVLIPTSQKRLTQNLDGPLMLIAACSISQEANQVRIPGHTHSSECRVGAFTLALYRAFFLRRGPLTYQDVKNETQRILQNWNMGQTPTLNGKGINALAIAPPAVQAPLIPVTGQTPAGGYFLAGGYLADTCEGNLFRSPNGTLYRVTMAGRFEARIEPLHQGDGWPRVVAPYRRGFALGNVPSVYSATHKNLGVEAGSGYQEKAGSGMIVNVVESKNGVYTVAASSLSGTTGPLASYATKQEAEEKAQQVSASLNAAWNMEHLLDSIGADSVHPMGLDLSADRGAISADYSVGDTILLRVASQHPGYLLLLAAEPDGSISILWPNLQEESVYLDAPRQFQIKALAPAGITRVTALLTTRPLHLPSGLLGKTPSGLVSYTVSANKGEAFLTWLQASLDCRVDKSRDEADADPQFSPGDVEEYSMNISVH